MTKTSLTVLAAGTLAIGVAACGSSTAPGVTPAPQGGATAVASTATTSSTPTTATATTPTTATTTVPTPKSGPLSTEPKVKPPSLRRQPIS